MADPVTIPRRRRIALAWRDYRPGDWRHLERRRAWQLANARQERDEEARLHHRAETMRIALAVPGIGVRGDDA